MKVSLLSQCGTNHYPHHYQLPKPYPLPFGQAYQHF